MRSTTRHKGRGLTNAAVVAQMGAKIRRRRVELGLSQTGLGHRVGVTFQQVQKYERGSNRVPVDRLDSLAEALHMPVVELMDSKARIQGEGASERIVMAVARKLRTVKSRKVLERIAALVASVIEAGELN